MSQEVQFGSDVGSGDVESRTSEKERALPTVMSAAEEEVDREMDAIVGDIDEEVIQKCVSCVSVCVCMA